MDTLSSSEFRRRYSALTKPTIVTVGGHVIGLWTPRPPMADIYAIDAARMDMAEAVVHPPQRSFTEFRPVPKPGRK